MEMDFRDLLLQKKTKLTGREAIHVGIELRKMMDANKNKKSWTIHKLAETLAVEDVRFIERLLRLADWPSSVHKVVLENEGVGFPFLRSFLDRAWPRSDSLIVAIKRKILNKPVRKKKTDAFLTEFEKIRRSRVKAMTDAEKLREEIKSLKDQIRALQELEDENNRLRRDVRFLNDSVRSMLEHGRRPEQKLKLPPSPDELYMIEYLKSRFGIRVAMDQENSTIQLECLSSGGMEKVLAKLMS